MNEKDVVVRFPPSPTGGLHVGTARAMLFNYLFAKQNGGKIIFRSEDTDTERSDEKFEREILEGLEWLGLSWDEGPIRQSERGEIYAGAIAKLLESGAAYQPEGEMVVKLRVEPQEIVFTDMIRGDVKTHSDSWGGDFVIARNLENPVYHLAVVVDDADMGITHVIRGEDHISNTARHILIQRALGVETPEYAHLPLLLDSNKKKLSKRVHGKDGGQEGVGVLVNDFKAAGYLPEALLNYLALLGWNPGDDREIFSLGELVEEFDLNKVQKAGAIFSLEKLGKINQHYIRELSEDDLFAAAEPWFEEHGLEASNNDYWRSALKTEQERVETLAEFPEAMKLFASDWVGEYAPEKLVWRKSTLERTKELLGMVITKVEEVDEEDFSEEKLQQIFLEWIDSEELGRADTLWPFRVALTGREMSPSQFEVAAVLGKEETLKRLREAQERL